VVVDSHHMENKSFRLRDIHIDVENIFEDIKKNKSSFVYKTMFYMLFSISAVSFVSHATIYGFGIGVVFLVLLIAFYLYFLYNIKVIIRENIKSPKSSEVDPENPEFLKNRIQYISEGIRVTIGRAGLVRNLYIIFFPLMSLTVIDLFRGPLDGKSYFITFVVAVLIGGVFWFYYFRSDITDIESDIVELEELKMRINKLNKIS